MIDLEIKSEKKARASGASCKTRPGSIKSFYVCILAHFHFTPNCVYSPSGRRVRYTSHGRGWHVTNKHH